MTLIPNPGVRKYPALTVPEVPAPPAPPVAVDPVPAPAKGMTAMNWVMLAIAILLIIAQQTAVSLERLPQSSGVTVALIVVATLLAVLPQIQVLLSQYQANLYGHRERMARIQKGE